MTQQGSFYAYTPSKKAAYAYALIYILTTLVTFIQTLRYRSWIWLIMITASCMETLGYIARIISIQNVDKKGPFVISFLLIVLAPVVIAAAIYILFGRVVVYVTPRKKQTASFLWISPRFLTPIFVLFDLAAFAIQGIGATEVSTGTKASTINSGKTLAIAGLGVQIGAFGLFSIISIRFNIKSRNFDPIPRNSHDPNRNTVGGRGRTLLNPNWKRLLLGINISCVLILIRSVYRMIEFITGKNGYVSTHEWTFYAFDTVPIHHIFMIFLFMPPGSYVPYMSWRVPKRRTSTSHRLEAQPLPRGSSKRQSRRRSKTHTTVEHSLRHSNSHGEKRRHSHSQRRSHRHSHSESRPRRNPHSHGRLRRRSSVTGRGL